MIQKKKRTLADLDRPRVDVSKLSNEVYIQMNEAGAITLKQTGVELVLTPAEALQLKQYLVNMQALLNKDQELPEGPGAQVRIYDPKVATIAKAPGRVLGWKEHAGVLFDYGYLGPEMQRQLMAGLSAQFMGGFTKDLKVFVLVPLEGYHVMFRRFLLEIAERELGRGVGMEHLGDFIEQCCHETPEKSFVSYCEEAHDMACDVQMWLLLAGERSAYPWDAADIRNQQL